MVVVDLDYTLRAGRVEDGGDGLDRTHLRLHVALRLLVSGRKLLGLLTSVRFPEANAWLNSLPSDALHEADFDFLFIGFRTLEQGVSLASRNCSVPRKSILLIEGDRRKLQAAAATGAQVIPGDDTETVLMELTKRFAA